MAANILPSQQEQAGEFAEGLSFKPISKVPGTVDRTPIAGLFPKPSFRRGQRESLEEIDEHFMQGKKFVLFEGPTGSGKSANAVALARKYGASFCTPQKILQTQYTDDFPEIADVRGRNAYACDVIHGYADVAPCVEKQRKTESPCYLDKKGNTASTPHFCPYADALDRGSDSAITLFNYHSFLAHTPITPVSRFQPRDLLILDEAHELEGFGMDQVQVTIEDGKVPGLMLLPESTSMEDIARACARGGSYYNALGRAIEDVSHSLELTDHGPERIKLFRQKLNYKSLVKKMLILVQLYTRTRTPDYKGPKFEEMWIKHVDHDMHGRQSKVVLKPVFAAPFIPGMLLWRGTRVLFMSATILDKDIFCRSIGIRPQDAAFVQAPCYFPVENRLIHVYPCGDLSYNSYDKSISGVMTGINRVLAEHPDHRGIIHSHSWKVLKDIQNRIRNPRLIFQDPKARDREECVDMLRRSRNGVLVAPAMHAGLDLKDDLSRFQIWTKMPYPDFSDPQIKARSNVDPDWPIWQVALKFAQGTGRSIRSETDWASTYVLDSAFLSYRMRSNIVTDPATGKKVSVLPAWLRQALRIYSPAEVKDFLAGKAKPTRV